MYGLIQTTQAPFQFNWCSTQPSQGGQLEQRVNGARYNICPTDLTTGPVYASVTGRSPNVYYNQKGTLTYSFVVTGPTATTVTTAPPYNNSGLISSIDGELATFSLTITDGGNGQKYNVSQSITWGAL